MGKCKDGIKSAYRTIKTEARAALVEPTVMRVGSAIVDGMTSAVADGALTKDEAQRIATSALKALKPDLSTAAAQLVVALIRRAQKLGVPAVDLGDVDPSEAGAELDALPD